jgi:D-arabinose 1-dehydrogenase-like Zn-dependent alcohol dehydrogenase
MLALVIPETGGPEIIMVEEVPDPEPDDDEVLIAVEVCTVNHTDVWVRRGYEGDPPIITGIDVAGEIAAVGDRVVVYWNTTSCDDCEFCNDGEQTMCLDTAASASRPTAATPNTSPSRSDTSSNSPMTSPTKRRPRCRRTSAPPSAD